MIVIFKSDAQTECIQEVIDLLAENSLSYAQHQNAGRTIFEVQGDVLEFQSINFEAIPGVERAIVVSSPYKLVSKVCVPNTSGFEVAGHKIGGTKVQVIAGPCAVESKEQIVQTALAVKEAGASFLRGGAFKPRTSPYSFQGLGEEGLKYLAEARERSGLPIITEIMDVRDVELVAYYADILQVGARNMQNYSLLKELSRLDKPILLKRGQSATLEEWLMAAEYILTGGNNRVILCERGIRTFETHTRNTLDISAVPSLKDITHLPVFVDPSHGTGRWEIVAPMAKAALAAGADGLIIEVHPCPAKAASDGKQSLTLKNFSKLMDDLRRVAVSIDRHI